MKLSRILYLFVSSYASIFLCSLATDQVAYAGTSIDDIRERALSFYNRDYYNAVINVVFLDLRFTCNGSITSIWFIASENTNKRRLNYPEFRLWHRPNISAADIDLKDRRSPPINGSGLHVIVNGSDNMALYQYRLETPMPFESGDLLGMRLKQSLLLMHYLDGGGVRNYIRTRVRIGNKLTYSYVYRRGLEREALLALEVSDESCLDGFLNMETLQQYMKVWNSHEGVTPTNTTDIPSDQSLRLSYVFPGLQFNENGLLEKWLFAAKLVPTLPLGSNHISIEFQVWRREGQQVSVITTNVTSPARTGYINVYEQTVHPPLPVRAGDYVGISVQSPSYLKPQWVSGRGERYQRIPKGSEGANGTRFAFAGRAIPLFAAQIQPTQHTIQPTSTDSTTATSTSTDSPMPTVPPSRPPTLTDSTTVTSTSTDSPMPTVPPSRPPHKPRDLTNNSSATIAAVVVVSVVILIIAASIAIILFVIFMRRKRKEQAGGGVSEQQKRRTSFFDNPVYEHQQNVLHKESNGNSGIVDHPYLEVPAGNAGRGLYTATGDSDSGYAEPGRIVVSPARSTTATPVPSSPLRIPFSPTSDPTFRTYHTLEQSQPPQEYIEPLPSSKSKGNKSATAPDTSNLDICSTRNRKTIDHEYHVLDPNTGGYHRLFTKGIYVPTQEERRESTGSDDYATIGERLYSTLAETKKDLAFFEECDVYWKPASTSAGLYSQLSQKKYREILHTQIKVKHPLGSGHFGEVNKGEWQCEQGAVEVAVKTLKRGSSEEDTVRFLQEAAIMGQFRHPNIVELLGVVTLAEHTMIILEYLSQGDLGTVLVKKRPMPGSAVQQDMSFLLLGFCRDIASGMEYLQRKAFVHRDLAARNILVSRENICKIGDFGMSRDLLNENYYISKGGIIPLKWTAPEALHYRKYSTASDVWSYGVVMYEIWSLGHKPYEGYTNLEVQKMLDRGERLAPPPGCPRGVYSLMVQCWHPDSTSRPTFLHLLKTQNSSRGQLLSWSHEDTWGMAEAIVLGAPLHEGRKLYTDLQNAYTQQDP